MKQPDISQGEGRLFIVILGMLTMLGPMAIDLYLPALPAIAKSMGEPLGNIQFTLSAYTIGFAIGQLIFGPLSDRFGRRTVMIPGLVVFIVTSLLASFSATSLELIIVRVIQAVGAASIMVNIPSMVRDLFNKEDSARAYSSILMVMTVAPLLAPIIGGQILKLGQWEYLFLFLTVMGCIGLFLAVTKIKETLPENRRSILSPSQLTKNYLNVLGNREAMGCTLAHSFFFGGMFAFITGSPFVYIELFHVKPEHYGLLFGANIIAMAIMNMINMKLIGRVQLFTLLTVGVGLAALSGLLLLLATITGIGGLASILVCAMLYIACMGLTGANANALALAHFPNIAGTANALAGALRFTIGGLASVAVGILNNNTAVPMAMVMAVCGALSVASLFLSKNKGAPGHELTDPDHEPHKVSEGALVKKPS